MSLVDFLKCYKEEKEEKCEENWAVFKTHISHTTGPISFKFGMQSCAYRGHKTCKFDRNQPSSYRDMQG